MKIDIKNSGIFGGLVGLVGAVGLVASGGGFGSLPSGPASGPGEGEARFCLLSDAPFFSDLTTGCYTRAYLRDLYTRDLVNDRGASVVVTMSSPPDVPESSDQCRTCTDYKRMQRLGWFALSGRDQRREEFFRRACAMLDYLVNAGEPDRSYFADGLLRAGDIAAIPTKSLLALKEAPAANRHVEARDAGELRDNPGAVNDNELWLIRLGDQEVTIQPLSHGDFNGDAIGDMLVYMRTRITNGSAVEGTVGYLTKTTEDGAVEFTAK